MFPSKKVLAFSACNDSPLPFSLCVRKAAKMNGKELGTEWKLERGSGKGLQTKFRKKCGKNKNFFGPFGGQKQV